MFDASWQLRYACRCLHAANPQLPCVDPCSGDFLIASSRWNRAAGSAAALCRLSEVTDWEEGGRTGLEHAVRIFKREVSQGERRVLVVRRQVSWFER